MAKLEVPLAVPSASPKHVPAEFYYRIPVRPIYKSYPVYHPSKEPPGYLDMLRAQEPEVLWDDKGRSPALRTDQDWIRAGELVFDSPVLVGDGHLAPNSSPTLFVREMDWYRRTGAPVTREGVLPFYQYVVREKGKIELGALSCGMCHTRIMTGGAVVKGAQGNFPFDRAYAWDAREAGGVLDGTRDLERALFGAPWLTPDPQARLGEQSIEEIAAAHDAIPAGVLARHRTSPSSPVQVPDLIGVRDRRYLDRTGLQRHNGLGDLMRYAALNQGGDDLASYDGFIPAGREFKTLPEPAKYDRYSDEQLHALALYVYSLRPPPNPNRRSSLSARGERIFNDRDNRCATCHKPPLYTNNELTLASDFEVQSDHPDFRPHHEKVRRYRPDTVLADPAGHRVLQSAVLARRLVSRSVRAQWIGSDARGLVRCPPDERRLRPDRLEGPSRHHEACRERTRFRSGSERRRKEGIDRVPQDSVKATNQL